MQEKSSRIINNDAEPVAEAGYNEHLSWVGEMARRVTAEDETGDLKPEEEKARQRFQQMIKRGADISLEDVGQEAVISARKYERAHKLEEGSFPTLRERHAIANGGVSQKNIGVTKDYSHTEDSGVVTGSSYFPLTISDDALAQDPKIPKVVPFSYKKLDVDAGEHVDDPEDAYKISLLEGGETVVLEQDVEDPKFKDGVDGYLVDQEDLVRYDKLVQTLMGSTRLNEREREILRLRFGFDGGKPISADEVGNEFGVTGERIRQIERRSLAKLRDTARWKKIKSKEVF